MSASRPRHSTGAVPPPPPAPAMLPQYPPPPPGAAARSHSFVPPQGYYPHMAALPPQPETGRYYRPGPDPSISRQTDDYASVPPPAPPGPSKKRARALTTSQPPPQPIAPTTNGRPKKEKEVESPAGNGNGPPSVLVREKKQKACANCRRAKLKCIVEDGQTDCVRCKARKERCVFYPRNHDEDWQQTLTSDVYSAINHLSHLSNAVHHLIHHLSAHQLIPPLPDPLPRYQVPDRDLHVLQGWGAELNKELPSDGDKRRKRKDRDEEDEDEFLEPASDSVFSNESVQRHASFSTDRPAWPPHEAAAAPPFQHRFSAPDIVPFRPQQHPNPTQLTPTSELNIHQQYFSQQPLGQMPPPPMLPPSTDMSPSITQVTPTSLVSSSPAGYTPAGGAPYAPPSSTGSQPYPAMSAESNSYPVEDAPRAEESVIVDEMPRQKIDENGQPVLGCEDPRDNVITRGVVTAVQGRNLVNYFHERLSPLLFGYPLQFGAFPYLPGGPMYMTPFITGVLCLLASERIPQYHHLYGELNVEVTKLLLKSPAESWQDISVRERILLRATADSNEPQDASTLDDIGAGEPETGIPQDADHLDPELGIGPEEIVGACALATFKTDRQAAGVVATHAFRWARGWVKVLRRAKIESKTIAELSGIVPPERKPTDVQMARVWLLCYVVDGIECLHRGDSTDPAYNIVEWCELLVPPSTLGSPSDVFPASLSPADVVLVYHARLVHILRDWVRKRRDLHAAHDGGPPHILWRQYKFLTSGTNSYLEVWRDNFENFRLDVSWSRQLMLLWYYAKVTVNVTAGRALAGSVHDERVRVASWSMGTEAAFTLLQTCADWEPKDALVSLPTAYLSMFTMSAEVILEALHHAHSTHNWQLISIGGRDIIPILKIVSDALQSGGLPAEHQVRTAAAGLISCMHEMVGL
ncbi:hypothetical protein BCR39DRAFT_517307 [Naematelia encephala]|uniref:Zn(2)-C6 fungal-type domain-containing protein n=1 Tax=Naematelia encephala TaxID=71784 RepID=A0A1Y2BHK2_9TREE|nr:hypothetical protein BCR39DRAFT_517307 [Naematelia encephala]